MNVLSLFDGMSCGQLALREAGIEYENYFASEIDKYAIRVSIDNFPNTNHVGNVSEINCSSLPKIDLLIGGSPCQGFSFAGKQLNFNDPRSALFFEYLRIKNELKPRFFLLENTMMKKEYQDIISHHLKCQPRRINSNIIYPINRDRLYWTNIQVDQSLFKKINIDLLGNCETFGTIGSSDDRKIRKTKNLGALTASMYKGLRAAGRPMICKEKAVGLHIDELKKGIDYRMLTIDECRALQGVPAWFQMNVSKTQAYKMLGNGWTVDIVANIFKSINKNNQNGEE